MQAHDQIWLAPVKHLLVIRTFTSFLMERSSREAEKYAE
jgi:hypothetical protein